MAQWSHLAAGTVVGSPKMAREGLGGIASTVLAPICSLSAICLFLALFFRHKGRRPHFQVEIWPLKKSLVLWHEDPEIHLKIEIRAGMNTHVHGARGTS
jgi:hypothetical protein